MPEVVTELTIDARGAETGARAYASSMDMAEAAGDRIMDQTRQIERSISTQIGMMTRVAGSTSNAARSYTRLVNSLDPAARAQSNLARAQRTLDRAVQQGITTQEEANRVLDLARQKYDTAGREASEYSRDTRGASSATSTMTRQARQLVGVLASLGIALGVRQIVEYADAWTNAGNRISAIGGKTGEEAAVLRTQLADIAVETRSNFDATLQLYSRLAIGAESLGASQDEILTVVRTVNEAMALSGASASEAEGAIRQLGQALGSGQLRGDELNSILEQAPLVAQAIADQLGVAVTNLRDLGAEGDISSEAVFQGLLAGSQDIHEAFGNTESTVSQAMTNLETRFIEFVGGADSATGATSKLAEAINWIAENIDTVVTALGILAGTLTTTFVVKNVNAFAEAIGALPTTVARAQTAFSFLLKNPFGLAITAIATIAGGLLLWKTNADDASFSLEQHEQLVQGVRDAYTEAGGAVDDWASRIESATVSQALLDVRARVEDLDAAAQQVGFSWLRATPEQENISRTIETMRDLLAAGEFGLQDFNAAIDYFVEAGSLLPQVGVELQRTAAALDAARVAADEARAVLNILRGFGTAEDFADLGLTTAYEELTETLGATGPAATNAADGVAVAGDAAQHATMRFGELREAVLDALRALDAAGTITDAGPNPAFNRLTGAQEFHDGGLVGRDGVPRTVPSALFAFAPRLHNGLNLAADEFPAILQRGEMVIPAGAASSSSTGGGYWADAVTNFRDLGAAIENAGSAAGDLAIDLAQILISAKSPIDALEKAVGNLSQRAFSFSSQQFQAGNIGGGVLGLIGGVVLGIIGNIIRRRRELEEARVAWADMADQVADFGARLRGEGGGSLVSALSSAEREMEQFVAAAEKAQASTAGLAAMMDVFVTRQLRQFGGTFEVMIAALDEGLGKNSPAVNAAQNVISVGEALRGFVADTRAAVELGGADGAAVGAAEQAAASYALSLLGTAPELSEVEQEMRRMEGTSVHLQALLEDLGMSAEQAGQAVADGFTVALDRVRDRFAEDLQAQINDAHGQGYLNEITDLIAGRSELLNDAGLLGIGTDNIGQLFALEAQAIVDGAGLVGEEFAKLIDLFPDLAGVVHEASNALADAMDRINDAASNILGFLRERLAGAGSTLSPIDRLSAAQQLFDQQLGLAQGGDVAAQAGIGGFAGDLLDAARDVFASSPAFQEIFGRVTSALLDLSAVSDLGDPALAELRNSIISILSSPSPGFAGGGLIGNGIWNVDSVRAGYADGGSVMLAGGEFVTRAPSVNPATFATLDHINRTGRTPGSNDNAANRRNFSDLMRVVQTGSNANVLELREGLAELGDRLEARLARVERAIKDTPSQRRGRKSVA